MKTEAKTETKIEKIKKIEEVNVSSESCKDKKCPFHGKIRLHGRTFTGKVIKIFQKTATIEFLRPFYVPKYERFEKRKTRIKAHCPSCINLKEGNDVKLMESRPISKTKNFIVVEVLK